MFELAKVMKQKAVSKIIEKSPEVLIGLGVGSFIGSTVVACKATLNASHVLERHEDRLKTIDDARELSKNELNYSKKEEVRDRFMSNALMVKEFAQLYGPSVILGTAGLVCIVKSRNIMKDRNLALISAYNLVSKGFELYRSRVREELGDDMDHHFKYGTALGEKVETIVGEDGKKIKVKTVEQVLDGDPKKIEDAGYERVFDVRCSSWCNNDDYNLMFIKSKQDWFNLLLSRDGTVFLNDVYQELGFPKTKAGQMVGWSNKGNNLSRDGAIIFKIEKIRSDHYGPNEASAFIIDFNVDGVIYDQLSLEI